MSAKDKLKTYLKEHQNIQHMCYLPVHAAMVCFVHQCSKYAPDTETKIYEKFTQLICCVAFHVAMRMLSYLQFVVYVDNRQNGSRESVILPLT